MTDIAPALTADEWAQWRAERAMATATRRVMMDYSEVVEIHPSSVNGLGVEFRYAGGWSRGSCLLNCALASKTIAILNDLLPEGDARKITQEDIDFLADAAFESNNDGDGDHLARLLAKLRAILPPGVSEGHH